MDGATPIGSNADEWTEGASSPMRSRRRPRRRGRYERRVVYHHRVGVIGLLAVLLTVVLVVLKLTGVVDWGWSMIFLPMIVYVTTSLLGCLCCIGVVVSIFFAILGIIALIRWRIERHRRSWVPGSGPAFQRHPPRGAPLTTTAPRGGPKERGSG